MPKQGLKWSSGTSADVRTGSCRGGRIKLLESTIGSDGKSGKEVKK